MRVEANKLVELCASKDKARCSGRMACVELDVERSRLLSTDGHRVLFAPCAVEPGDVPGPIPVEVLSAARKLAKAQKLLELSVACSADVLALSDGRTFPRPKIETPFPPVDSVVPKLGEKQKFVFSLNARYLLEIARALGSNSGGEPQVTLEMRKGRNDLPIRVTAWGDNRDAPACGFALLMPVRTK